MLHLCAIKGAPTIYCFRANMENETESELLEKYFSSLTTISVDYKLSRYWDPGLSTFHSWSTAISIFGSIVCITLNSSLLLLILRSEEFCNLMFFPICLQAVIDILGPGLCNIAYVLISLTIHHTLRTTN